MNTKSKIDAMRGLKTGVEAWEESVTIPTYSVPPADLNPMFLEKRVYQGSSGRVYPLSFFDQVSHEIQDQAHRALHLENEFIYLMILPDLGGRIHIGYDKSANYDFFYRQEVIKPALVGLAGPWISGGVEFNWPQHHRPSTYLPVEWMIEESEDGSKTIWLSEHEPMSRMKGMHGVCLRPGSSLVELKVRLYNRTSQTQTFLWWANVAAKVHEQYQSFFPPDVTYVADHAKRATATFPSVSGDYYGVHYGERGLTGVPFNEGPAHYQPDGSYPPDRLDWYSNIPVPTSYMVVNTDFNFFGGYDHKARAGFVHVADRYISPGKKQWTWGNHEFGYAWDRNLTEDSGPYVELMAGVYTDNQPDFSYLAPHETKTFSQFWYPIQQIGPPINASSDIALAAFQTDSGYRIGVSVSRKIVGDVVVIDTDGAEKVVASACDLAPGLPFTLEIAHQKPNGTIQVREGQRILISAELPTRDDSVFDIVEPPNPATEPPEPQDVGSNDELYVVGTHLEQYRHATRMPEAYWEEAIRRDPGDARCHIALGRWRLRRGEFQLAESHFRSALARDKSRNPNPRDGEAEYQLGLVLDLQKRDLEAYAAFAKAAWNYAWKGPANLAMARIVARKSDYEHAQKHLATAVMSIADANAVRHLQAALWRHTGQLALARNAVESILTYDPLDHGALYEATSLGIRNQQEFDSAMRGDVQNYLDLAFDYIAAGLHRDAVSILEVAPPHPIVAYTLDGLGHRAEERFGNLDYVFPNRLEEMVLLEKILGVDSVDSVAAYLLGNFYYDRRRYEEAIHCWERTVASDPRNSIAWRNLGIAYQNVRGDSENSNRAYDAAVKAKPTDSRLVYERDQLWKRTGISPEARLRELENRSEWIIERDDLTLEFCSLLNATGQPHRSRQILESRNFAPWEGGEGIALGIHTRTYLLLAREAEREGRKDIAIEYLETALRAPSNLGEARHLLANVSDIWMALGDACSKRSEHEKASEYWTRAAEFRGDFQEMSVRVFSEMTYYRALALRRLQREVEAIELLNGLKAYAEALHGQPAKIDYFATSLPTMLLFNEDLQKRQSITAQFLLAQALLGLGHTSEAHRILREVLQQDPNYTLAQDLIDAPNHE